MEFMQARIPFSLRCFGAVVGLMCGSALPCSAAPSSTFETPPVLSAKVVLPKELVSGADFTVDDKVISDGYFNKYNLKTRFGDFQVEGQQLLELRIGELQALAELDKMSSSKVLGDAVYESGKATVLAPVKLVEKTYDTVSDPNKVVDTVKGIPEGAGKVFSWAYRQSKGAAQGVANFVSSDSSAQESEASDAGKSVLSSGKDFGLSFIGYTKRERQLFQQLQANPYSSNKVLQNEVVRVAGIGTAVGTAFRFVPGIGLLGPLSTFNRWYGRAEQLSLYEDPDEIRKKNQAGLIAMGTPEDLITKFQKNPAYTPWTRRFVVASLTDLGKDVTGRALFIKAAVEAQSEPATLYFVSVAEYLEKLDKTNPINRMVASLYIPAAITKKGVLIVPLSVDYLFWTKEVAGIFDDFQRRVALEEKFSSVEIVVRGRVSPNARKALEGLGAKVTEGRWIN
jgi:hypothetical protein